MDAARAIARRSVLDEAAVTCVPPEEEDGGGYNHDTPDEAAPTSTRID
jgi:hypothetical protein